MSDIFSTMDASAHAHGAEALGGHNLAMVCKRELGVSLDQVEDTSNWSRRPLGADQLHRAARDVEVLIALYERLKDVGVKADVGGGG
ncbi:MAG: hypothetical protein IPL79_00035 [Myxococcales bacterium]|nr:hypothetical protein [Myxococcales bacterium]